MKKFFRIIFSRILYIATFVLIQVAILLVMFSFFKQQFAFFYSFCVLLSILAGLYIINKDSNPAYKIAWLIPILLFPILGGLLYVIFGGIPVSKKTTQRMEQLLLRQRSLLDDAGAGLAALEKEAPEAVPHACYIQAVADVPVYTNTLTHYYPSGETMYAAMLRALEQAERFIFMEYFIVEEGEMWDGILDILTRKVAQGVEVRMMYDDMGCLFTLPQHYALTLRQKGIKTCVFNPFHSILSSRFNNRDHRKICVVDGQVGFTGGINIADEYINVKHVHGHWKDTGIRLEGDAVWSLSVMFLTLWDFAAKEETDCSAYRRAPAHLSAVPHDGFVQTYTDIPLDGENVGESVYLNLINRARDYVYITTPYLVLDNETINAMKTAAKSGVDIRILTPFVPDKKFVQLVTRSYYEPLLKSGVRIFEYSPGFIHAKSFVCDDQYAVVGTVNLDYRSLFLHFECAAWMFRSRAVPELKKDILNTLAQCQEITPDRLQRLGFFKGLLLSVLRIFAPLM